MARALLGFLAYSIAITAARNHDYEGPHVPLYPYESDSRDNMQSLDDFDDRPAETAISFDIGNYEEQHSANKQHPAIVHDNPRIHRKNKKLDKYRKEDDVNDADYEQERVVLEPKPYSRKKDTIYRSDSYNKEETYSRGRNNDYHDLDRRPLDRENVGKMNIREHKKGINHYYSRKNGKPKARRKPRDRAMYPQIQEERENEETEGRSREDDLEAEYPNVEVRKFNSDPKPSTKFDSSKHNFADGDEFFDLKRINRIKSKLPKLMGEGYSKANRSKQSYKGKILEGRNRRSKYYSVGEVNITIPTLYTTNDLILNITSTAKAFAEAPEVTTAKTSTEKGIQLSLEEKSRRSIMRKALKKESLKGNWTSKPPVLMQVTDRMQTLVMVERRYDNEKDSQIKKVSDDSPARLTQAKKLMRHKLVSNAKDIQELTDNWDDMVCDYIDVRLLDNDGTILFCHVKWTPHLILPIVWLGLYL